MSEGAYPDRPRKGDGTLTLDLGKKRKRQVEDEAMRRSRRTGKKVYQADFVRLAIDRELADPSV